MKLTILLFTVPAVLFAASFTDNFESYTPGDDLDSSAYWFTADSSGSFIIADEGGNNIAETVWNGYDFTGYVCMGSAVWSNGTIGCDVKFTGSQAMFALMARINGFSSECYIAGIYPAVPPLGTTVIAYVDATGEYTILSQDYFYPMNENTWYDLDFEVTGTDTVSLKLFVNGSVNSTYQDTEHSLQTGISGVITGYEGSSEPVFSMDNFEVVDTGQPLTAVTFGGIKALFR